MKHFLICSILIFCAFANCYGQYFTLAKTPVTDPMPVYSVISESAKKSHKPGTLSTVGGCTIIAGIGFYAWGYLKKEQAYGQNSLSLNQSVDQSAVNTGQTLETAGTVLVIAGVSMIIVDAIYKHAHRNSKLSIIAARNNEIGFAYTF